MVNERYSVAMSETLHYLKGINQKDLDRIPNKFIQFLNDNCLIDYECNFDYTKPLKELDISNIFNMAIKGKIDNNSILKKILSLLGSQFIDTIKVLINILLIIYNNF